MTLPASIIHMMNLRASAKYNISVVKHNASAGYFLQQQLR
jgi:hypothetical protein